MNKENDDQLNSEFELFFNQNSSRHFDTYQDFSRISSEFIPNWFRPMVEDQERNIYYKKMLEGKVKDKVVIDLGAGTGMWTMEALAGGAKFVYLVEKNPVLVKYLTKIFSGKPVKVLGKDIADLKITDFDNGSPEIVVHEIFSTLAISEGIVPAFQKINSLLKNKIAYYPQYFWMNAQVTTVDPLTLTKIETDILGSNADVYFELIYPARIRSRAVTDNLQLNETKTYELNFVDLSTIDEKFQVSLADLPVDLHPGKVHQVYLGFKFSAHKEEPCFDTLKTESHWGGVVAEFYVAKSLKPQKKVLKFELNEMNIDSFSLS
ncbi:MAG: rRNA adenine N-6-methyltransferase family protein [Bacteriovoracaceae bacterium]